MGLLEIIGAGIILTNTILGWYARQNSKDQKENKKLSRGRIIAEAEKIAWHAVQTTKQVAVKKGTPLTPEQIASEYKKECLKYVEGKGMYGFTLDEIDGIMKSAEVLTHAAKSGYNSLMK